MRFITRQLTRWYIARVSVMLEIERRDAAFLERIEILNLTTRMGDLDLSFMPAWTGGYLDLVQQAAAAAHGRLDPWYYEDMSVP